MFIFIREVATVIAIYREQGFVVLESEARNCNIKLKISKKKADELEVDAMKGIVTYFGNWFIKFQPFKF